MTGILLINIGSPKSTKIKDVRKFLSCFLNDPRVINLPFLLRKLLVNLIIVPFRAPKSAKLYKQLFNVNGSPLIYYSQAVKQKLQLQLGNDFCVEIGMRYSEPSIYNALEKIKLSNPRKIIVLPLFPQYASSTTGSAIQEVFTIVSEWTVIPEIQVINQFYDNQHFINSFAENIKNSNLSEADHVIFSYHGLPLSQVAESHYNRQCNDFDCEHILTEENKFCYHAQCYETSRLIAEKLGIETSKFTTSFQSRFAKNWLSPFTDDIIKELAEKGYKNILVVSPSFVADCLETTVEIGIEYNHLFKSLGGQELTLVNSLNDNDLWINALAKIITFDNI